MKSLSRLFIICVFLLSALLVDAQVELTQEHATSTGLTVRYPAEFNVNNSNAFAVTLQSDDSSLVFEIRARDGLLDFSTATETPETLEEAIEGMNQQFALLDIEFPDPAEPIQLNGQAALQQFFDFQGTPAVYIAYRLANGEIATVLVLSTLSDVTDQIDLAYQIAESVTLSEVDITAAAAPEAETAPQTQLAIPEGAIPVDQLPPNVILFRSGGEITYPDNWQIPPDFSPFIEDTVLLMNPDYPGATITILDMGFDTSMTVDIIKERIIPSVASLSGDEDYSPEEDIQSFEAGGRVIEFYSSIDKVEQPGALISQYYIIPLEEDHFGAIQVLAPAVDEELLNGVRQIVESFVIQLSAEDAEG